MAALSAPIGAIPSNPAPTENNPVAILATRLSRVPLEEIERLLGVDKPTASRIRSGEKATSVQALARLIPLCGLKLVDREKVCVDRRAYESMTYIASKAMADQAMAQQLIWDEGGAS